MIPSKDQPSDFGDRSAAEDVSYAEILAHLGADPTTWAPAETLSGGLLHDSTHALFGFHDSLPLAERRGVRLCDACLADGDYELEDASETDSTTPSQMEGTVRVVPTKGPAQPSDLGDRISAEDVSYAEILAHLGTDPTTLHESTHDFFGFHDSLPLAERRGVRRCSTCHANGDDGSEGEGSIATRMEGTVQAVPTKGPAPRQENARAQAD